jgi:hypothetical protein
MRLGDIIAEIFAALLVICVLAIVLFLGGRPVWPKREVTMIVLLPPDAMTTGSVKRSTHPNLPDSFNTALVPPRPEKE